MLGLEATEPLLTRDNQSDMLLQPRLDHALTAAEASTHVVAGIGLAVLLSVLLAGVRRWLYGPDIDPQHRPGTDAH